MGSVQLPVWQGHPDCNAEQLVTVSARMANMAILVILAILVKMVFMVRLRWFGQMVFSASSRNLR